MTGPNTDRLIAIITADEFTVEEALKVSSDANEIAARNRPKDYVSIKPNGSKAEVYISSGLLRMLQQLTIKRGTRRIPVRVTNIGLDEISPLEQELFELLTDNDNKDKIISELERNLGKRNADYADLEASYQKLLDTTDQQDTESLKRQANNELEKYSQLKSIYDELLDRFKATEAELQKAKEERAEAYKRKGEPEHAPGTHINEDSTIIVERDRKGVYIHLPLNQRGKVPRVFFEDLIEYMGQVIGQIGYHPEPMEMAINVNSKDRTATVTLRGKFDYHSLEKEIARSLKEVIIPEQRRVANAPRLNALPSNTFRAYVESALKEAGLSTAEFITRGYSPSNMQRIMQGQKLRGRSAVEHLAEALNRNVVEVREAYTSAFGN